MSLKSLIDNIRKPWLTGRMEDLALDGNMTIAGNTDITGNLDVMGTTETAGLILPSPSTQLSIYQFYSSSSNTWTGPGGTALPQNYFIVRIGNQITLGLVGASQAAANNTIATSTEAIPTSLRPDFDSKYSIIITDNSAITRGVLTITAATGIMTIAVNISTGFMASGNWGFSGQAVSWIIQ